MYQILINTVLIKERYRLFAETWLWCHSQCLVTIKQQKGGKQHDHIQHYTGNTVTSILVNRLV
jgi:hypothetical protein